MKRTPVLIAGGGPVGLMLANVLGRYGVACVLAERNPETTRHPKMDITNGRSMELFRKFGLADDLRRAAVPEDHPFDVSWITSFAGHELHRFRYPSPQAMRRIIRASNDGTQPREPAMRVSQVEIEPVLKKAADNIADGEEATAEQRANIAARIAELGNAENESYGIEFGYHYDRSSIVAAAAGADYPTDPLRYVPTTLPGTRLPSSFLRDGSALFDRLGEWFTLIDFGRGDREGFVQAARKAAVPLDVLALNEPELERIYGQGMVLVRPDQHIAWRGSPNTQADAERTMRRALGWGMQ